MLPFHKRIRSNSVTEIDTADIEAVELPKVSPPSPRMTMRPAIKFAKDDERTMLMPEKRRSSAPPARVEVRVPSVRMPPLGALPQFGPSFSMTDEVTMVRPGSRRSLLTMKAAPAPRMSINSMMREELASQLEPSKVCGKPLNDVGVSSARASESVPAMAMTAADASSTVLVRNPGGRPTAVWAMALLGMGLFGGLLTSIVTRNELAPSAAAVQGAAPARQDVAANNAAAVQAPIVQQQIPAAIADALGTPSTPACGVDPVAPPPNPTAKATAVAAWTPAPAVEKPEIKPTPRVAVARVARPAPAPAVKSDVVVAVVAKPAPKPAAAPTPAPKKALGDDMEQANAADALARAQLEAALNR